MFGASCRVLQGMAALLIFAQLGGCGCSGDDGPGSRRDAGGRDTGADDASRADVPAIDAGPMIEPDAGPTDAGPMRAICEPCTDHPECGPLARCVTFTTGERACVPTCNPDLPDCPRSFDCVLNF